MEKNILAFFVCLLGVTAPVMPAASRTFVFHNAIRNLDEFRTYAGVAARLKPYGAVQVDIGVLVERSPVHMPGVRSPWHDYGSYMATMWAFFPAPKLAPHLPAEWVSKNRELLLAKAAVLRKLGLEAVFSANETQFLPESFFRQYPHLRGPRVDHPMRSAREEFAWCVDSPQTLEMIEWMTAELKRHAPEIRAMHSWNNDSGSGLCWLTSLYPGPNGPAACRGRDPGARVRGLIEAMDRGARKGGGPVQIRLAGNFHPEDRKRIEPILPSCARFRAGDNSIILAKTRASEVYPILGLIDVLPLLATLEKLSNPEVQTIDIDTCQPWYYRANEPIPTVQRLVDIVEDSLKSPTRSEADRTEQARRLAVRWGGEKNADRVLEAFNLAAQSFSVFAERPFFSPRDVVLSPGHAYTVTNRLITRPLVAKPELLTREEEAYFLPYIFATEEQDGRLDYNTAHGYRRTAPSEYRSAAFKNIHDTAVAAAGIFDQVTEAPDRPWFRQLALSLRMWASTVRSHDNFYSAQLIRDRHGEDLAKPPRIALLRKDDPDLLLWNEIQRDEFDNTNELRAMLENGGLELVARARNAWQEDVFLLGPDILGALRRKADIMRNHWLDGQRYLTPPRTDLRLPTRP
jgi:hypothetical protein